MSYAELALLLGVVMSWSITPTLISLDRRRGSSIVGNGARAILAGAILLPLALSDVNAIVLHSAAVVGLVGTVLGDTLYVSSLRVAGPGIAVPVAYSYIVISQLIGSLLGESIKPTTLLSAIVAVLGVAVAYRGSKTPLAINGLALATGASLAWSMWVYLVNWAINDLGVNPITLNALRAIISGCILLSISLALLGLNRTVSEVRSMPYTMASGILGYTIGGTMFYEAIKVVETYVAVITTAAVPVLAVIISSILLRKEVELKHILGALLVSTSIFLALTSS